MSCPTLDHTRQHPRLQERISSITFLCSYSKVNQRANGPVNAHLISGPTVSTKTSKIGQGKPRVIIYINFVELESPMLRAKFPDHRTSGSEKTEIFKSFYHIWAWWPSWSCDLYNLFKLSFPLPRETPHKICA